MKPGADMLRSALRRYISLGTFLVFLLLPFQALAAKGTLELEFTGTGLQDLGLSGLTAIAGSDQAQVYSEGSGKTQKRVRFRLPEGSQMVQVIGQARIPFSRDYGPFAVQAGKVSTYQVDLSGSFGNLRLTLEGNMDRPELWLFAEQGDTRPLIRMPFPEGGVMEHLPAGTIWLVLVDRNGSPRARQEVFVEPGQTTPVTLRVNSEGIRLPARIRVRFDSANDMSMDRVTVRATGDDRESPTVLQYENGIFTGEIGAGETVFEVSAGREEMRSPSLLLGFWNDNPVDYLLHVTPSSRYYWCDEAALQSSQRLNREARELDAGGRLFDALMLFRLADTCLADDSAKSRVIDIGARLAAGARESGHPFNRGRVLYAEFTPSTPCGEKPGALDKDGVCLGGVAYRMDKGGGSIEWLAATGNTNLFWQQVEEFMQGLDPLAGVEDSRSMRSFLQERFSAIPRQLVTQWLGVLLGLEEKAFAGIDSKPTGSSGDDAIGRAAKASLGWLQEVVDWAAYGSADSSSVKKIAKSRGLALAGRDDPQALAAAISYFELARYFRGPSEVRQKASLLGNRALDSRDLNKAAGYFEIARDEAGLSRLEAIRDRGR